MFGKPKITDNNSFPFVHGNGCLFKWGAYFCMVSY